MPSYDLPKIAPTPRAKKNEVFLIASGDLRDSANSVCWPTQVAMEKELTEAVEAAGYSVTRAHEYKPDVKHGLISSQKEGFEVFARIPPTAPIMVAETVWQYSHHVLAGLMHHEGPILTVANWSGTWPGLVGMLNLNGSLTKAGRDYSTLWTEDFTDRRFVKKLIDWLKKGKVSHCKRHAVPLSKAKIPSAERKLGQALAEQIRREKVIMGIFDEGCMGMYNAIIPDELLLPLGVCKERLSQSALCYEVSQVSDKEAHGVRKWLDDRGMTLVTGEDEATCLTDAQIHLQCKMYIAAVRIADDFGCDLIGIQYQQGLKDMLPASDLVEGLLNNADRPPVFSRDGKRVLYEGEPLVHFNEVDECAGLDGLMTNRIHRVMGQPIENTLHDVRWGDWDASGSTDQYVWVFEISGAVPPAHLIGGYSGASSERQPPMYFPSGGGTIKGVSRPGEIVWSRIFVTPGKLHMDLGRAEVVELPKEETQRRWDLTTSQWPMMHAVLYGITRDRFMARHKANHIQVAYATNAQAADRAMLAKAAMAEAMGMKVSVCGTKKNGKGWG